LEFEGYWHVANGVVLQSPPLQVANATFPETDAHAVPLAPLSDDPSLTGDAASQG